MGADLDPTVQRLVRVLSDGGEIRWERELTARPDLRHILVSLRKVEHLTGVLSQAFSEYQALATRAARSGAGSDDAASGPEREAPA